MTLKGTTAAEEKRHAPTEQEMLLRPDDLLRPYGFRVPIEGDPFAPEEVVLAEIVDDDRPVVRAARQFPVTEEPAGEDLQHLTPGEVRARLAT